MSTDTTSILYKIGQATKNTVNNVIIETSTEDWFDEL